MLQGNGPKRYEYISPNRDVPLMTDQMLIESASHVCNKSVNQLKKARMTEVEMQLNIREAHHNFRNDPSGLLIAIVSLTSTSLGALISGLLGVAKARKTRITT